jgi:hypothetical protein
LIVLMSIKHDELIVLMSIKHDELIVLMSIKHDELGPYSQSVRSRLR